MSLNIFHESVCIFFHIEEICFLTCLLNGSSAIGALAIYRLCIGKEGFTGSTVPALVFSLINVALFKKTCKDLLDRIFVIIVGSSYKMVVFDVHIIPKSFDLSCYVINVKLGSNIRLTRKILDLLTVLVSARAEEYVVSHFFFVSSKSICHNSLIRVSKVRLF